MPSGTCRRPVPGRLAAPPADVRTPVPGEHELWSMSAFLSTSSSRRPRPGRARRGRRLGRRGPLRQGRAGLRRRAALLGARPRHHRRRRPGQAGHRDRRARRRGPLPRVLGRRRRPHLGALRPQADGHRRRCHQGVLDDGHHGRRRPHRRRHPGRGRGPVRLPLAAARPRWPHPRGDDAQEGDVRRRRQDPAGHHDEHDGVRSARRARRHQAPRRHRLADDAHGPRRRDEGGPQAGHP